MIRKPLDIKCVCYVSEEERSRNTALSPDLPPPHGSGRLAVVGGAPSVRQHLETLRAWPGDVWAINEAVHWCHANGIDATLYTVCPAMRDGLTRGITRAVIGDHCEPRVFAGLKSNGAEIYKVDTSGLPGPTSAVAATSIAIDAGYDGVTFFGCESSYGDVSHIYTTGDGDHPHVVVVKCGGESFATKPEFLLQAEQLAQAISTFPCMYDEQSGGLLRALVRSGLRYEASHVSRALYDNIVFEAA